MARKCDPIWIEVESWAWLSRRWVAALMNNGKLFINPATWSILWTNFLRGKIMKKTQVGSMPWYMVINILLKYTHIYIYIRYIFKLYEYNIYIYIYIYLFIYLNYMNCDDGSQSSAAIPGTHVLTELMRGASRGVSSLWWNIWKEMVW